MPQTPLSLARPQGRWQTLSTYPYGECWSRFQGVKGKMHDFVALDPLSISVGVAKLTEADGAETCQGLQKQPRSNGLYRLEATASVVRVQEVFPAPCHVANARCGQRPRGVGRPLGVAQ